MERIQDKSLRPKEWAMMQRKLISIPPPFVTAQSWVILDGYTGKLILGHGETEKREIASLTKIMTAYTALELIKRYELDSSKTIVTISEKAAYTEGTTASLEEGDKLTLKDLFYAMLLPSGNDASIAIAQFLGKIIKSRMVEPQIEIIDENNPPPQLTPIKLFVKEMNLLAEQLELKDTSYANPHGLINYYNKSSAIDIARLSFLAMRNNVLREVVNCRRYKCFGKNYLDQEKEFKWKNTNRLLWKGYNGIKTGITNTAGPCLATSIIQNGVYLIIVILNSKTMDHRWTEVKKLTKWAIARILKIYSPSKIELNSKGKILF
jgi:D-alanyl-D-alanine carboxypeptidase